jgi:hypothetical protein
MTKYMIRIIAEVNSSLSKTDLESRLVASLFDVESEEKVSDGDNDQIEVEDYELTEAITIDAEET